MRCHPLRLKETQVLSSIYSGYALLQIEPFPRARIMKIGYNVLQELRKGIPEDFVERIYLEERTKYMM
jgi:hypothetical protein